MSNSPRSASSCLPTASTSTMPKAAPGRSAPPPSAPWQSWVAGVEAVNLFVPGTQLARIVVQHGVKHVIEHRKHEA